MWSSVRVITFTDLTATCKSQLLYLLSTACCLQGVTYSPGIAVGKVANCGLHDIRLPPFHWAADWTRSRAQIENRWSYALTPLRMPSGSPLLYTAKGRLRVALTAHACADGNVMERTAVYSGRERRQSIGSPST